LPAIEKRAKGDAGRQTPDLLAGKAIPQTGLGLSKSDKKITSALTNEGKDRPQVKVAGQDYRSSKDEAGNDPFRNRRVWSQTS
jgi:hypothetical protein